MQLLDDSGGGGGVEQAPEAPPLPPGPWGGAWALDGEDDEEEDEGWGVVRAPFLPPPPSRPEDVEHWAVSILMVSITGLRLGFGEDPEELASGAGAGEAPWAGLGGNGRPGWGSRRPRGEGAEGGRAARAMITDNPAAAGGGGGGAGGAAGGGGGGPSAAQALLSSSPGSNGMLS
ncbi:hypothetical protein MNEG_15074, partial [Monoraphidium neglectum]